MGFQFNVEGMDAAEILQWAIDTVSVRVDPTISGHIPHFIR